MENSVLEPPKGIIKNNRISRLSSIYFAMTMACLLIVLIAALSSFIIPFIYCMVMLLAICALIMMLFLVVITFGLILLAPNNPIKVLFDFIQNANTEKVMNISQKLLSSVPYLCIAGLVTAVVSIIALSFTKEKKAGKITGLVIVSVIMVLILILYYAIGGQLWQS